MQTKIHKAKMITLFNKMDDPDPREGKETCRTTSIHAEITLLKNLIQKNQQATHKVSDIFFKAKQSSDKMRKYSTKGFSQTHSTALSRKKSLQLCNRQQNLTNNINSGRKLLQISSFTKLGRNHDRGYRSERIERKCEDEEHGFIPLGKIYYQLRPKTQMNDEMQLKQQLNSSLSLKMEKDKIEEKKRLSIFAKPSKSIQRSILKQQNRANGEKNILQMRVKSVVQGTNENLQAPTPW